MIRRVTLIAATVIALGGCSSQIAPIQPMDPQPQGPAPSLSAQAFAGVCDHATIASVDDLVTRQLAAFHARDFASAFALSSSQFQAISSAKDLEALINDGKHAEVLDSVGHAIVDCRSEAPGTASAAVSVTGANGRTVALAYQLVYEDGHWAILMSRPMGGHGQVAPSAPGSLSA